MDRDIARGLSKVSVRVVEVIAGKTFVGLEIPNVNREIVYLSEILRSVAYDKMASPLALALGKDIGGKPIVVDIQKMPHWFEIVFVSPSHHRVHHASNILYLDKNMGMCLIIWDKLLGTFQAEVAGEPVTYGLVKPMEYPYHPVKIIFHEWEHIAHDLRKKTTFANKLKYLFMPPGWSHDGSSKTARELREGHSDLTAR